MVRQRGMLHLNIFTVRLVAVEMSLEPGEDVTSQVSGLRIK